MTAGDARAIVRKMAARRKLLGLVPRAKLEALATEPRPYMLTRQQLTEHVAERCWDDEAVYAVEYAVKDLTRRAT